MSNTENYKDFLGSYFGLEIDGVQIGFFTACSGLSIEVEVVAQKMTNGAKTMERKLPGKHKYSEIVLKRGYTPDKALYKWFDEWATGKGDARKTAAIVVMDRDLAEVARFSLDRCWPSKLSASDLSTGSDSVVIEELTVQHELLQWK